MALLFGVVFEESLEQNGVELLMAFSLWVIRSIGVPSIDVAVSQLQYASAEVSEIVFFLLGATTTVEIVDAHRGLKLVTDNITLLGLLVPSVVSLAVPLAMLSLTSDVNGKEQDASDVLASEQMAPREQLVFAVGTGALIFVLLFKAATGLAPYMGMLLGLGVVWILRDAIHYGEDERQKLKVPQALSRIDTQGALFFLGILPSVSR
uniref:Na+/H+ antiporter n=1 Tax=Kalanchoe fedtschenkoi TaxID=63787 RepID=A0A7N0T0S6_KALFE